MGHVAEEEMFQTFNMGIGMVAGDEIPTKPGSHVQTRERLLASLERYQRGRSRMGVALPDDDGLPFPLIALRSALIQILRIQRRSIFLKAIKEFLHARSTQIHSDCPGIYHL